MATVHEHPTIHRNTDIIRLIYEDHEPLKELIEILKDTEEYDFDQRYAAFEEFAPLLVAHAKPEEEILYRVLKRNGALREMGFEAEVEHGLADQMIEEAKRESDPDIWSAKVKVLAELVENHMEDEESELLPEAEEILDREIRSRMGNDFLALKLDYLAAGADDAPHEYELEEEDIDQEGARFPH